MKVVIAEGTSKKIGYELGYQLMDAIKYNINIIMRIARTRGINQPQLKKYSNQYMKDLSTDNLELMEGLSEGSKIPLTTILQYNYLNNVLCPEGCTVFAAVGKATAQGNTFLLKNVDGTYYTDTSTDFNEGENMNVAQILKYPGGNITVGVAKAGSIDIGMGLNKYGVATASNQGHTKEFSAMKNTDMNLFPNFRGQFMREGLEYKTAKEAVQYVLKKIIQIMPENPGILWFVDADNIFVIETSPREISVQHITDGFTVRANHFLLLDHLKDEDISCICRYSRGRKLMEENDGKIDFRKLKEFSMDHKNGPGENSICRHSKDPKELITKSASIMEIDRNETQKSKISIALGSPCWAWRSSTGNFTFQMDEDVKSILQRFNDGTTFKEFIKAEPFRD